jgi:hypothetical protein
LIRNATVRKNSILASVAEAGPSSAAACRVFALYVITADVYRQRAADAKKRAAQAKDLSVKKAFEEVAKGWLALAEQMEWMDRQRSTDEENDRASMRWLCSARAPSGRAIKCANTATPTHTAHLINGRLSY